ncbi:MAG: acylphosphatase [Thermodesulfobacteriota bacterium]
MQRLAQGHVWISGRVQGVFFRHNTQQQALMRGISGWVRNLPDGRVEAVFQGERTKVEEMLRWCQQGPPGAWVREVEVRWEEPDPALKGFRIAY